MYFGHCTTGSLDRAISGSCGARITKQVFQDFCERAKSEQVDLTSCNSELLKQSKSNYQLKSKGILYRYRGHTVNIYRVKLPKGEIFFTYVSDNDDPLECQKKKRFAQR